MRLIDADAIPWCDYDLESYHSFTGVDKECVDELPTITFDDLREKGEWRLDEDLQWTCTNCKGLAIGHPNEPDWQALTNYCPNCGAKMGGGE